MKNNNKCYLNLKPNSKHGLSFQSVLSPVFVYLLISRVSGIPLLEKAGMKKWGHLPEYQAYIRDTPELVPFCNFL